MAEPSIETCRFAAVSGLFGSNRKAREAFNGATHDFCWGGNNRSLITAERFKDALEDLLNEGEADADEELEAVIGRAEALPDNVYIDLEN